MDEKTAREPMDRPIVGFKRLHPEAVIPRYMTDHSVGMDLTALEQVDLPVGSRALVGTGLAMQVPIGYEAQIRPRSGLALKHGIDVANAPATIDPDYRGEVKVILENRGEDHFTVEKGMRFAQLVICPAVQGNIYVTNELSETSRGDGGFGHSGT